MNNALLVIPAIKKNAVIPDQLIKKLNGITLIQRAINTAKELTANILLITDSEEISLIAKRNNIRFFKDSNIKIDSLNIITEVLNIIDSSEENIILYRANTPLLDSRTIKQAYNQFLEDDKYILTSVKHLDKRLLKYENNFLINSTNEYFKELKAFYIFKCNITSFEYKPFIIEEDKSIEIETYQDWWICEKLLQQKRIIFNVIGSIEIGMGHIYHSLSLAHEITNHEVIFVCDDKYEMAVEKIALIDYKVISTSNVIDTIINLKPDLVINDILNTKKEFIQSLKTNNIQVVNFEDLGNGSKYADLVINELYDESQLNGENYLWGYKYLALRDEFDNAKPNEFINEINEVLITFGGTDQNNLTLISLKSIISFCEGHNIKINIVCGGGYSFKEILSQYLNTCLYKNIELTYASGVISQIMEKSQVAISSNGRTVYELAHMNIPTIVVSHHERENTHTFASLEKGFINLGIINENTAKDIEVIFEKIVLDIDYRKLLFMNIKKYNFSENKQKVVKKIMELM